MHLTCWFFFLEDRWISLWLRWDDMFVKPSIYVFLECNYWGERELFSFDLTCSHVERFQNTVWILLNTLRFFLFGLNFPKKVILENSFYFLLFWFCFHGISRLPLKMEEEMCHFFIPSLLDLKVGGNEKQCGSGGSQMLDNGLGPWRSRFIFNLNIQFLSKMSYSACISKMNRRYADQTRFSYW